MSSWLTYLKEAEEEKDKREIGRSIISLEKMKEEPRGESREEGLT